MRFWWYRRFARYARVSQIEVALESRLEADSKHDLMPGSSIVRA